MINIDQYVADFLRDAQFRIAEMGVEMDAESDFNSPRYEELYGYRLELYQFMAVVYVGEWSIPDGYNHLDWSEYDTRAEMEYLRNRTSMVTSPFTTFVGNYPQIVENITGINLATGLPVGVNGQYVGYDINGNPVAIDFPVLAGAIDTDTALTFFS